MDKKERQFCRIAFLYVPYFGDWRGLDLETELKLA